MAYDEVLAARIRRVVGARPDVTERRMFGGLAFMMNGNMFCGVVGGELMARVGPQGHDASLARPGARPMDFTGRPMKGMVFVGPSGIDDETDLRGWVDEACRFVQSLPAKEAGTNSRRQRNSA